MKTAIPGESGIALGQLAARGEQAALSIPAATLTRVTYNSFFQLMLDKIDSTLKPADGIAQK